MTCPSQFNCTYREGHLARVQIERAPGVFWDMWYDYTSAGAVSIERFPGGSYDARYEYDAQGRLLRQRFPTSTADSVRFTYDSTAGDAVDPTMVSAITGERSGADHVYWARAFLRNAVLARALAEGSRAEFVRAA